MASHQEIEVKLRTDPDKVAKLRRSQWWRELAPVRRQSLHSVYFDTDDQQLRDRHISLRTRTDGNAVVQTIKMLNGSSPVARREWETLVPDPIPDPSLVIDPALPQDFRKLTSADLQPVFDVDVKRETRRLTSDRAAIDVSLDDGAVRAGAEREPVHEIELELIAGELADLFGEAQRISDVVDGRLHARSKADVGYALKRADRRYWSRAAKLNLAPAMTAGESFRHIILNAFSHLTANDDCARLNLDIEGVHQCRIALRRLRSALKIYRPLLCRKRIEPIDEAVRWLGKILGTARDLDVLQADLLTPAIAALGEAEPLAPLIGNLEARKAAAYASVREALASARYRHLLIDLCALAHADDIGKSSEGKSREDGGSLDQPLTDLAASALSRAHAKLIERGSGFESLSKVERHDVRIALKRLRYALDFFGGVFEADGEAKKKFVKKLTRLQDDLGRMNDVAVAETMLAQLVGVAGEGSNPAAAAAQGQLAFAAGGILGWHRRRAAEIDTHLVKDWNAFARAKPFWLSELP
jgi:triphosphatase